MGSISAGIGIGNDAVSLNLAYADENFLGSGNRLKFNFDNSDSLTRLSAQYYEAFYTVDGVSRTISANISEQGCQ